MMRWFAYDLLSPGLQAIARPFHVLALQINHQLPDCEERSVALRKLLESRDAAVRAAILGEDPPPPSHIVGKE